MATNEQINVLLFGIGAIGGFFAFILSRSSDVSLTIIARSNYDALKVHGLDIDSLNHGKHHVTFDNVYTTIDDIARDTSFDYIVCTNKAVSPAAIPPIFKRVVTDKTTFVVLQNGVGNEEYFQAVYPGNTVVSGVLWVHAIQTGPQTVKHLKTETTELGLHRNLDIPRALEMDRLTTFHRLLVAGGTNAVLFNDIQLKRWEKTIWNIAWNPITMLTMVNTAEWLSRQEANTVTRRLFREAISIGIAAGVPLRYDLADELIERVNAIGGLSSSMATDAREGRPLEVEVILGVPLRKAKELNVDVPTLSAIFALTEAVNGRLTAATSKAVQH